MLPVMNDLVRTVGIESLFEEACIDWEGRNFESLYETMTNEPRHRELVVEVEKRISEYFCGIEIPDAPTLYDRLLLSLRQKDLIASFNWDPLLAQSWKRLARTFSSFGIRPPLPEIVFLHGNVSIGICDEHRVQNFIEHKCSRCSQPLKPTRLLFPIATKDYSSDPFIESEWSRLKQRLEGAFLVTIFGYSAPRTDVEARDALRNAWSDNPSLLLAEVEVIDIRNEEEVGIEWQELTFNHHYKFRERFEGSYAGLFPRRSCDALHRIYLNAETLESNEFGENFPNLERFADLIEWAGPYVFKEQEWPEEYQ